MKQVLPMLTRPGTPPFLLLAPNDPGPGPARTYKLAATAPPDTKQSKYVKWNELMLKEWIILKLNAREPSYNIKFKMWI